MTQAIKTKSAAMIVADKSLPVEQRLKATKQMMIESRDRFSFGASRSMQAEKLIQSAYLAIRKNPRLIDCDLGTLFMALSEAAMYGWICDGVLGHASLVPFKREVVLIPGYKGYRELIRRAGDCETLMESVHQGDEYEYRGPFAVPVHVRSDAADRKFKPLEHAYVLGYFSNGITKCFSWSRGECLAHRNHYAQNWKRSPGKDNPWHEENPAFRVMCMKTVLLDAVHRGEFPMSSEAMKFANREMEIESGETSLMEVVPDAITLDAEASAVEHQDSADEQTDFNPAAEIINLAIEKINASSDPERINKHADTAIEELRVGGFAGIDIVDTHRARRLSDV